MRNLIFGMVIMLVIILGGLAYIGVVPFLSPLITKPRDLGSKSDAALVTAIDKKYNLKNQIEGGVVPENRQAEFTGSTKLDLELTSNEITSVLNVWKARSPKLPIRDIQVRFNSDGTGEISGILEVSTAIGIAKSLGYSDSDIDKGKSYVKYVAGDLPFYVKGVGSVTNNQVNLAPTVAEVGKISVPEGIVKPAMKVVEDMIERRINQVGNVKVDSLTMNNGALQLKGTFPDTVK